MAGTYGRYPRSVEPAGCSQLEPCAPVTTRRAVRLLGQGLCWPPGSLALRP